MARLSVFQHGGNDGSDVAEKLDGPLGGSSPHPGARSRVSFCTRNIGYLDSPVQERHTSVLRSMVPRFPAVNCRNVGHDRSSRITAALAGAVHTRANATATRRAR